MEQELLWFKPFPAGWLLHLNAVLLGCKEEDETRLEVGDISMNLIWSRVTLHGVPLMQVKESSAHRWRSAGIKLPPQAQPTSINASPNPGPPAGPPGPKARTPNQCSCRWSLPTAVKTVCELLQHVSSSYSTGFHSIRSKKTFSRLQPKSSACGARDGGM